MLTNGWAAGTGFVEIRSGPCAYPIAGATIAVVSAELFSL
jgi:hypothetical protein